MVFLLWDPLMRWKNWGSLVGRHMVSWSMYGRSVEGKVVWAEVRAALAVSCLQLSFRVRQSLGDELGVWHAFVRVT